MAKRVFELPTEQELTKDQRMAIRKPLEGQYLVYGAPGTGKSVVALWRFKKLAQVQNLIFLTYNNVLYNSNKTLIADDQQLTARMFKAISWFYKQYHIAAKKQCKVNGKVYSNAEYKMPTVGAYMPDFAKVHELFQNYGDDCKQFSLIIDEGQDLALGWYETLRDAGTENFFIVADQNQRITSYNCNNDQLRDFLALEKTDVIQLQQNWRNTTPIAALANYFYTDKASALPELPSKPSANTPILYEYSHPASVIKIVVDSFLNDKSKLIGFIVVNNSLRERWRADIINLFKERHEDYSVVQTYESNTNHNPIDFKNGGIVVLNDMSVKGIEFDEVFILTDSFSSPANQVDLLKKRMYVMTSRARERLFILKQHNQSNDLCNLLPSEDERVNFNYNGTDYQIELLKRISI